MAVQVGALAVVVDELVRGLEGERLLEDKHDDALVEGGGGLS